MPDTVTNPGVTISDGPSNTPLEQRAQQDADRVRETKLETGLGRDPEPESSPAPETPPLSFSDLGDIIKADEWAKLSPAELHQVASRRYAELQARQSEERQHAAAFREVVDNPRLVQALRREVEAMEAERNVRDPAALNPGRFRAEANGGADPRDTRIAELQDQVRRLAAAVVVDQFQREHPDFKELRDDVDALLRRSPSMDLKDAYELARYRRQQQTPPPQPQTERPSAGRPSGPTENWQDDLSDQLLDRKRFPTTEAALQHAFRTMKGRGLV